MKHLLGVLLVIISITGLKGQTTLYSTNFGTTGTALPTGWTKAGTASAQVGVIATNPSTGYTGASGTLNLADGVAASAAIGAVTVTYNNTATPIATTGFTSVDIRFGAFKIGYVGNVSLEWSADGNVWIPIINSITLPANSQWYSSGLVTLPPGALNQANLRFRFTFNRTAASTTASTTNVFRIDDFTVLGNTSGATATGWSLTGNAATTASNFIGTTDALPLRLRTGNTDRLVIDATGNITMGANAVSNKLSINGGTAGGTAGTSGLQFTQLNSNNNASLTTGKVLTVDENGNVILQALGGLGQKTVINNGDWFGAALTPNNGGTGLTALGAAGQQLRVKSDGSALEYFTPVAGGASQWTTNGTNIHYNTGNVGIGKIPLANLQLDVNGSAGVGDVGQPSLISSNLPGQFYVSHGMNSWGTVVTRAANDVGYSNLAFYHTRSGDASIKASLQSGDGLGRITFHGVTGDNNTVYASSQFSSATEEVFPTYASSNFSFFTTNSTGNFGQRLKISADGNLGIGTNAPSAKLHSVGTVRMEGLTANNTLTNVLVTDANGNISYRDAATLGGGGGGASQWTTAVNGTDIYNGNTGNVGIGTTNPDNKLNVANGRISVNAENAPQDNYSGLLLYARSAPEIYRGTINMGGSLLDPIAAGNNVSISGGPYAGNFAFGAAKIAYLKENSTVGDQATAISFSTRNTGAADGERMRIAANGNVGIGTANPTSKLTVAGEITINASVADIRTPNYGVLIGDEPAAAYLFDGDNTGKPINIGMGHSNVFKKINFQSAGQSGDNIGSYNFSYNPNNGPAFHVFDFIAGNTKFLLSAAGNLILGDAVDDGNKLQVNGNLKTTGFILPTSAAAGKVLTSDANGVASWQTPTGGSGSSYWSVTGTNNISNSNAGLVIIGAVPTILPTDANLKLAVNGNIYAKKLKITQTDWADYVFDANYKLPTLKEVEQYIKTHKHLPDVPSAAEVEKNGIDVGNNQAALLKKIEELTLYMIEQNKKMEAQQKEIDELKKKVGTKQ
jgi:hypothetical protein